MDEWVKIVHHYLQQSATIHIYSSPNFTMECFTSLLIFIALILLFVDVSKACHRWPKVKKNSIYYEYDESMAGEVSNESLQGNISRFRGRNSASESRSFANAAGRMNERISEDDNSLCKPEKKRYADQLLSITPKQYVRMQMEHKLKQSKCILSLSTLCKNVVNKKYSAATLARQLETAKEELVCNRMTLESKYVGFKTKAITESLFNMLEGLINSSSLNKPLPFKGDITTLALDVADLTDETNAYSQCGERWGKIKYQ